MSAELRLRIISALVLAVVVLATTWLGGVAFHLLAALIGLLIYYEWSTMTGLAGRPETRFANLFGWASVGLVAIEVLIHSIETAAVLVVGFAIAAVIVALFRRATFWLAGGVLYAGLSIVALAALRDNGLATMLFIFAIVWATDILAYFVGRALKGPKLAPAISPGKTWSGAIGGTIAGVICGLVVASLAGVALYPALVAVTLVLSIGSQAGDLFESWIKRRFGVKDSSHLIPGHGGVMDRVDGLVFACFLAFIGLVAVAVLNDKPIADTNRVISPASDR
jgi:phosphatidate cytidylyltransferase